jgi:two-component system phosphate regulon sensor histidine kinase PhoR
VKGSKVWLTEARRVLLWLAGAAVVGSFFDQSLLLLTIVIFAILTHWLLQLWRIQEWLSQPETTPPEGRGIWGDIFDRIYHLRRKEKEGRAQLQATVDYLRDSFASMRDGTVMVDETGAIQWSNTAAHELLGLRYPEDRGQALLNLLRIPEFHRYFLAADYSSGLLINIGTEADLFLQIDISHFGEGDRLIFARDVTDITRMEQMRRDFVGNVSHELRTPLTVISGYLETMLDNSNGIDSKFIKPLKQMAEQSARMESLLKDLLWLSRIESVHNIEKHEPVSVRGILEELSEELSNTQSRCPIDIVIDSDTQILGDYRELHSAVSNLILNAIKYSDEGSTVICKWYRQDQQCILSVIDTGPGIAATHLPRLTERFYRVDDSRSSATGGTGLGLAIVKHVAMAHSAGLTIESVQGVGSNFSLVFPPEALCEDESAINR